MIDFSKVEIETMIDFFRRLFYNQYRRYEDVGVSSYLAETYQKLLEIYDRGYPLLPVGDSHFSVYCQIMLLFMIVIIKICKYCKNYEY